MQDLCGLIVIRPNQTTWNSVFTLVEIRGKCIAFHVQRLQFAKVSIEFSSIIKKGDIHDINTVSIEITVCGMSKKIVMPRS